MDEKDIVLRAEGMTKAFPGVMALDDVSLTVRRGTVHALMGENGAGKSTLMKCIFGLYQPDKGRMVIDGVEVRPVSARDAMDKGISMIHQELHPIRSRDIMENLWVGRIPCKKRLGVKWVDKKRMYNETKALFDRLGIHLDPKRSAEDLPAAHCQLVEIARAVSYDAKVIIMDEPTSSLTDTEVALLFRIIKELTKQGVAIIYISHKMEEILQISDDVTIMRDGRLVGSWPAAELTQDSIISHMVGRKMENRYPQRIDQPGDPILQIEGFTAADSKSFKDVSLTLRKGEILGIGGLVGAQRTELVEAIFGLRPLAAGTLRVHGAAARVKSPRDAIRLGVALLTEERRATGVIPMLSVLENMVVAKSSARPKSYTGGRFFLNQKLRAQDSQQYIQSLKIKTPSGKTQLQYLSGGNQQKVLLGRWLLTEPDILLLDEPTRGIDVGAKYEIYTLMAEMAKQGKSIIMVSSEMPELMGMSDRIAVMCEGRLSGILDGKTATDEDILRLASSVQAEGGNLQ